MHHFEIPAPRPGLELSWQGFAWPQILDDLGLRRR
jgi:hypothetical protein